MKIMRPEINDYMLSITPTRHPVLTEMEDYARANDFPIIGPLVGQFLQQIVALAQAKRIFEMGSGYGYSAIWFALAMPPEGVVECTEMDEANIERGKRHAAAAGVAAKIRWQRGDALESMRRSAGEFDIILNDVDKHQYPEALNIAWPRLRRGGVMITDNVLWSGRIVDENPPSKATAGILEFNRRSYALPDALCSLVPIRDGLMVAVKK